MSSGREAVLGAVRRALGEGRRDGWTPPEAAAAPPVPRPRRVPSAMEGGLLETFLRQLAALGERGRTVSQADLPSAVEAIQEEFQLGDGVGEERALDLLGDESPAGGLRAISATDKEALFRADHALVLADFAIAATGTVGFADGDGRSRLLTVVPPLQVVLVPRSVLLGDLDEALAWPGNLAPHEGVVWITGSSRTADIEGIIIRGAHGPKQLVVLVVEDR